MKIKIAMEGMHLSADVGENAEYLFVKIANMLLCGGIGKDKTGKIVEKLETKNGMPVPEAEKPDTFSVTDRTGMPEAEETDLVQDGLRYKGFIYWKCPQCGKERAVCLKKESRGFHCADCGCDTLFTKPLRMMYLNCECGRSSRYVTNMEEDAFDVECVYCGTPVAVKWNGHGKRYETIRN